MIGRPSRSTRTHTLVPSTTRVRSPLSMGCDPSPITTLPPVIAMVSAREGALITKKTKRAVSVERSRDTFQHLTSLDFARDKLVRSEEHTSELQSLMRISYAVFCLKNNHHNTVAQTDAHIAQT